MLFDMDSLYGSAKKLLDYLTHLYPYNYFLVDNVNDELVKSLRDAIVTEDRVKAIQIYLKLDKEMDLIRSKYCGNSPELPYRSSFRSISKDMYRELKRKNLINHDDVETIAYILKFISTSEYWQIRDMLVKKSLSFYMYNDIPLNPNDFPSNYIYLEAILDYCIKIGNIYLKWH